MKLLIHTVYFTDPFQLIKRTAFSFVWIFVFCSSVYCQPRKTPYVILISFDGFRYDYVSKFDAPNFKSFIKKGTQAEGLIPSFPSKTIPNHYTIVTGLYPGHHGLVDNTFYDPERKEIFEMKIPKRRIDPYYYGGVPLWKLAQQHGLKSASFFWVGSELPQPNMHPDYYFPYHEATPDTVRLQQVLTWLRLPESERPNFITLYFSSPDHEGHTYGPSSEETKNAVLRADKILGTLMNELQTINLPVNVIVVSDHGMHELKTQSETFIFLDEILNPADTTIKIANGGTQAHIYIQDNRKIDSIYTALKRNAKNFSVYKQKEFPARWHYANQRSGDLLITAHPGYYIRDRDRKKILATLQPGAKFGAHGYDGLEVKDMSGIFYAQGPNIQVGKKIAAFQNIHIYPFIAKILNLTTPQIDGDGRVLEGVFVIGK
jgi:predicted AlkP superfamily pyrophosphatase or phosphodiesterase